MNQTTFPSLPLRYGVVAAALSTAEGVDEGGSTAFENRLKHLRRSGFPNGVNLGKAARYDYSPLDVLSLAAALRLIDAYAMPTTAIMLVEAAEQLLGLLGLERLVSVLTDDLPADHPRDGELRRPPRIHCVVFGAAALSDLGSKPAGAGRYVSKVDAPSLLVWPPSEDDVAKIPASAILLRGDSAFDPVLSALSRSGIDLWRFAASLGEQLALDGREDFHDSATSSTVQHSLLTTTLRLLARPSSDGEIGRRLAHLTARLALAKSPGTDLSGVVLDDDTGLTLGSALVEMLDHTPFPIRSWAGNWPAYPLHAAWDRAGSGDFEVADIAEWVLGRLGKIVPTN